MINHIKQLGGDTAIYGIAMAISQLSAIFLIPLYTRIFSPSEYGVIALITSFTGFLLLLIAGLDNAAGRWFYDKKDVPWQKTVISTWFWYQFILGFAVVILVMSLSKNIAAWFFENQTNYIYIIFGCFMMFTGILSRILQHWLRYTRQPIIMTFYTVITLILKIGMIILFISYLKKGIPGFYTAQILTLIVSSLFAIYMLKSWISINHFKLSVFKEMMIYSLPVIPAAIASWGSVNLDRFILNYYMDKHELGIYAIAIAVSSAVNLLFMGFQYAWGPYSLSIRKDINAQKFYAKIFSLYFLFGNFICTLLSIFSVELLNTFTTEKYFSASSIISIIAFSNLALGSIYIVGLGSTLAKKSKPVANNMWVNAGFSALFNFIFIPIGGVIGAALSRLLAFTIGSSYLYRASQKYHFIPYKIRDVIFSAILAVSIIAITKLIQFDATIENVFFKIALMSTFLPLAFYLGIVNRNNIEQIKKIFTKNL